MNSGGAQKLLGVYMRRLSTYSRRQTFYMLQYTDKKCFKSRGGAHADTNVNEKQKHFLTSVE